MTVDEADHDGFPSASDVLRDFARSEISSERKQRLFLSCSKFFRLVRHAEERRRQMMAIAAQGNNPYNSWPPSSLSSIRSYPSPFCWKGMKKIIFCDQ